MRVLVTGAAGFVGRRVVQRLDAVGETPVALVRPGATAPFEAPPGRYELAPCDLADAAAVRHLVDKLQPEMAIHLAWHANPRDYLVSELNYGLVAASLNLAQALASSGCRRLVSVGTCFEYDLDYGYLSETTPTRPTTPYAACKLGLSLMLEQLGRTSGMAVAWPRLFYLYGPGERRGRLMPEVMVAALEGREAPVTSGIQVRDYLHVEDVASALVDIALSEAIGPVNVGSGEPVSVGTIATAIGELAGAPELVRLGVLPDRPNDPPFICADNRKLRSLGWEPRFTLRDGLGDTLAWWRSTTASQVRAVNIEQR